MPVAVVAAIGIAGALMKANQEKQAAKGIANAETNANQQAMNYTQGMYNQSASNLNPFISAGQGATNQLQQGLGPNGALGRQFTLADFQNSPGYQFQMQQGLNAIQNSAAARGGAMSGGVQKALQQYGTGLAEQSFGQERNAFMANQQQNINALGGLAGRGENAAGTLGQFGMQTANMISQDYKGIGNAQANQFAATAAANNQSIGTIGSTLSSAVGGGMTGQLSGYFNGGAGGGPSQGQLLNQAQGPGINTTFGT